MRDNGSERGLEDNGCTITSAIESLAEYGTCLESVWPYNTKQKNRCPSDEAYSAAAYNTIIDSLRLKINLQEMKACLAQGFPFVFGVVTFKSFNQAAKKGVVPMPKSGEETRETHGRSVGLCIRIVHPSIVLDMQC